MTDKSIKKRIQAIQTHLGLKADGLIGTGTLTALENALFKKADAKKLQKNYSLTVSKVGIKQIFKHEISSAAYYKKFLSKPVWPGGASGVTIGVGYDLAHHSASQIRLDWGKHLGQIDLERLLVVSGIKGESAKIALKGLEDIVIDLNAAEEVFYSSTLPRYAAMTLKAYPGVADLFPDSQAGLLSLVFNRGTRMSGESRKEMAAIKALVANKDYDAIAEEIKSMKRLWKNRGLDGLLKRRDDEAKMVSQSKRSYQNAELVNL